MKRLRIQIQGAVQGVGFRPFVYKLAILNDLKGWVGNTSAGVVLEVEGSDLSLENFQRLLVLNAPPLAILQDISKEFLEPAGFSDFRIVESSGGERRALVLPDVATCDDCLAEISDPSNRRYRYPFTNCTNCGPRYSIINSIPYDRPATTMAGFEMCPDCLREYRDPSDRRFHAQPNACPKCGPYVQLWDQRGDVLAERDEAIVRAASHVKDGMILAVKGLGGFHLIALASSDQVVARLRDRKGRRSKPFALMFPDIETVGSCCIISEQEKRILLSRESPIVLLRKCHDAKPEIVLSENIAPGNPELGIILPYTPLHHILLCEIGEPVVATSGNLSDEPICIDECEALERLSGIADVFLVHNRPITRHVDDSILRIMDGSPVIMRRARGYAPLPVVLKSESGTLLAVGAHLKNTLALVIGRNVFVSQHIGDLETRQAAVAFDEVWSSIESLYHAKPQGVIRDLHPDYISSIRAEESKLPVTTVQHHVAHVYSCMLDNGLEPPVLGVSWDGTGYGPDGSVWGGEFIRVTDGSWERAAHLRTFRLPGGEKAVKEPRRSALGLLSCIFDDPLEYLPAGSFTRDEYSLLRSMISSGLNSPLTSSVGRVFDAVASILGLYQIIEFEGQAAMALEHSIGDTREEGTYGFSLESHGGKPLVLDWKHVIESIVMERRAGVDVSVISARFHNTLVKGITTVANEVGEERVVLSGGCFQNRYLTQRAAEQLRKDGFQVFLHGSLPPNDGGISAGQIYAAICLEEKLGRER